MSGCHVSRCGRSSRAPSLLAWLAVAAIEVWILPSAFHLVKHRDNRRFEYVEEPSPWSPIRMCREECQRLRDLLYSLKERKNQEHVFFLLRQWQLSLQCGKSFCMQSSGLCTGSNESIFMRRKKKKQSLLREHEEHLRLFHWQAERYTSGFWCDDCLASPFTSQVFHPG